MRPVQAIAQAIKGTASYSGRALRPEFWWFSAFWLLFPEVVGFVVSFPIGFMAGLRAAQGVSDMSPPDYSLAASLSFWTWALLCLPGLALIVRRLRDAGRSAWWLASIPLTFILGLLGLVAWMGTVLHASTEAIYNTGVLVGANLQYTVIFSSLPLLALLVGKSRPAPTLSEAF